jgi:hypothetical protein
MDTTGWATYRLVRAHCDQFEREAADERLARTLRPERKAVAMANAKREETPALRDWAREQIESGRRLRLRVAVFALGVVVLTPVWATSQYLASGGWPERLSANGNPGDWSPWIIWVALAWSFYVAASALVIHFRQPPVGESEIDRELARLASHGRT